MDSMPSLFSVNDDRKQDKSEQEKPKTLGSGFVTSVLGEGGAAIVYEIWNPKLEIHRAVKLWRPNVSEKDLQRFETEIKITSKLDHPNIVEIHTVGEWNGLPYIEMERIDGLSLQQILRTNGALPPVIAVAILIYICRALLYAHEEEFNLYGRKRKGVIHCDIKPANIMITRNGIVKLMDFGIANPTNVSLHTDSDKVTGSLQYMAPEQIRSRQLDARTDVYSVGVVLYEMLSGTKAFPSKQLLDVIQKRKANDYVPLSQFCVNLPKKIYRIVTCCMQLEPEDRYQNVAELMKILGSVYRRFTSENPQKVIQRYIESGTIPVRKIRITRQMLMPLLATVIPTALFILLLIFFVRHPGKDPGGETAAHLKKSPSEIPEPSPPVSEIPKPESKLHDNQAEQKKSGQTERKRTVVKKSGIRSPRIMKKVTASSPRKAPADPLDVLESLVERGKLNAALRKFAAKQINDGAYYALYARCYYESGDWRKAYEMARKSVQVPSKRIPPGRRRGQYLLYKAKYYSIRYDATPSQSAAQKAIDSWWEVREHFDGTAESAKASFAESEINRLSTAMNR